jgi:plastocyanin
MDSRHGARRARARKWTWGWIVVVAVAVPVGSGASLTAQTGTVEGTVSVETGPARRTAARYPSGAAGAREMQAVRAVVYLEIGGARATGGRGPAGSAGEGTIPSVVDLLQRDTAFAPSTVAVRAGTVVRFPNADPFFHNVFSYSANARFDLGRYPEGESREVRFDRPGIVRVFCEVHEFMRAVIFVTDHPYHAVVGDDGSFRIAGVPAGQHRLFSFHPDVGTAEASVVVGMGATTRVALTLAR